MKPADCEGHRRRREADDGRLLGALGQGQGGAQQHGPAETTRCPEPPARSDREEGGEHQDGLVERVAAVEEEGCPECQERGRCEDRLAGAKDEGQGRERGRADQGDPQPQLPGLHVRQAMNPQRGADGGAQVIKGWPVTVPRVVAVAGAVEPVGHDRGIHGLVGVHGTRVQARQPQGEAREDQAREGEPGEAPRSWVCRRLQPRCSGSSRWSCCPGCTGGHSAP